MRLLITLLLMSACYLALQAGISAVIHDTLAIGSFSIASLLVTLIALTLHYKYRTVRE